MSTCGKPLLTKLKGILTCAAGHHFRVRDSAPDTMHAADSDAPYDASPDGEIYPMGEVCPHPSYFGDDAPKKPVV
jgi:hypothetical protein